MKISVTQEDIDNSIPRNIRCPVQRAMERATDQPCSAGYFFMGPTLNGPTIETPFKVRAFMIRFDHRYLVEPFEFEVDLNEL